MKVTVTGATGLIGTKLVAALKARGDDVLVLSRSPDKATDALGVPALAWDLLAGPPPAEALDGRDAVVHLAGAPVAQRWNAAAQAGHPRLPGDRHAQPRGRPRGGGVATRRARVVVGRGLLRQAR